MTINPLDNPIWHALEGPHGRHALGRGLARHYPRDIAPFSAIAEASAAAYSDLANDLPARLRSLTPMETWSNMFSSSITR